MMNRSRLSLIAALAISTGVTAALAVKPASWEHNSEADFAAGETDNTVVTNLGDIKLATGADPVADAPEDASVFNDLLTLDGTTYIAAGPVGRLLRQDDDGIQEILDLDDAQIFALAVYDNQLLVAISGAPSRLAVLQDDELVTLVELPGVRYLWDVLVQDRTLFVATGVDGMILRIDPDQLPPVADDTDPADEVADAETESADDTDADADAEAEAEADADAQVDADDEADEDVAAALAEIPGVTPLLTVAQANILCLGQDAHGRLYAGTDGEGLVYRLTPGEDGQYDAFVLYDAPEPEIGALLVMDDGTVYAGTADAEQARPGRLEEAAAEPTGRPEISQAPPAEADEEDVPEPGDLPQVPPGAEPIGDPEEGAPQAPEATSGDDQPRDPVADAAASTGDQPQDAADDTATGPGDDTPDTAEAPTAEQYDRLREVIRQRLQAASRGDRLQVGSTGSARRPSRSPASSPRSRPPAQQQRPQEGNAIYRIDTQGFVSEVFRESVMILRIVQADDRLLVATGNEGQVFSLNPRAEETTTLVDLDAEQVPAMIVADDGRILLATANPAGLLALSDTVAQTGTYTSPVLDASQISLWGGLDLVATIPDGASIQIETRSGNVQDPEQAPWSPWTQGHTLGPAHDLPPLQPRQIKVQAPPARFLQYRLTFTPAADFSPVVQRVKVTYVTPNMRPSIASITASYPDPPEDPDRQAAPATAMNIEWEASDRNDDQLVYKLEYQPAGSQRWLLIAEDLTETRHEWETRRIPDGRYLLRVTASDHRNNPGAMAKQNTRRSDPVLVDNSRPAIEGLEFEQDGGRVVVRATAVDQLSEIRSIAYTLDSEDEAQPVLPEDLIFDSTREPFEITLSDLPSGPHVVTLRVTDARGNTKHEPVLINISE